MEFKRDGYLVRLGTSLENVTFDVTDKCLGMSFTYDEDKETAIGYLLRDSSLHPDDSTKIQYAKVSALVPPGKSVELKFVETDTNTHHFELTGVSRNKLKGSLIIDGKNVGQWRRNLRIQN